ncbi:MAG: dihydrolipoamide succinyltransferase, partial [Rhodothermales bacterium]|nr:dihydrolipoamide succinyltransferase [Rhodothermales bacterium]
MSNTVDIIMPESEEATDATVIGWFVSEGQAVEEHDPLLEVSTDKVTLEVAAPASGTLSKILVADNERIHPGHILGIISTGNHEPESTPEAKQSTHASATVPVSKTETGSTRLSPLVKRMVAENNLDVKKIKGSGRDGRITAKDVEAFLSIPRQSSPATGGDDFIPHTPMRRKISDHMVDSLLKTSPHVTSVFDMDMSTVIRHRQANRYAFQKRGGRLTITAYFLVATARALQKNPIVNSQWEEDGIRLMRDINIGIATALGSDGLIVPVVKRADRLSLMEASETLNGLVEAARQNRLTREDVQGG